MIIFRRRKTTALLSWDGTQLSPKYCSVQRRYRRPTDNDIAAYYIWASVLIANWDAKLAGKIVAGLLSGLIIFTLK